MRLFLNKGMLFNWLRRSFSQKRSSSIGSGNRFLKKEAPELVQVIVFSKKKLLNWFR